MLGIIAHRFPEYADFEKNKILRVFLANLKEKSLTDAAFTGLYSFLFAYPDSIKKENQDAYIFKCIMNSITMVENDRMYSIVKSWYQNLRHIAHFYVYCILIILIVYYI